MSETTVWYVGVNGQQQGPLGTQQVIDLIRTGQVTQSAYVYGPEVSGWTPITGVGSFAGAAPTVADQIDYEIVGEEMQFVEITLDPTEAAVAEAGAFLYMDPGIEIETVFGDGSAASQKSGFMGKLMAAGKRLVTGESLFMTRRSWPRMSSRERRCGWTRAVWSRSSLLRRSRLPAECASAAVANERAYCAGLIASCQTLPLAFDTSSMLPPSARSARRILPGFAVNQ